MNQEETESRHAGRVFNPGLVWVVRARMYGSRLLWYACFRLHNIFQSESQSETTIYSAWYIYLRRPSYTQETEALVNYNSNMKSLFLALFVFGACLVWAVDGSSDRDQQKVVEQSRRTYQIFTGC